MLSDPLQRRDVDWALTKGIIIDTPTPGATVTTPIAVTERGDVFEADFPMEVRRNGERISDVVIVFAGAWGEWADFETSISVDASAGPIELVAISPVGCSPDSEPNCPVDLETVVPLILSDGSSPRAHRLLDRRSRGPRWSCDPPRRRGLLSTRTTHRRAAAPGFPEPGPHCTELRTSPSGALHNSERTARLGGGPRGVGFDARAPPSGLPGAPSRVGGGLDPGGVLDEATGSGLSSLRSSSFRSGSSHFLPRRQRLGRFKWWRT